MKKFMKVIITILPLLITTSISHGQNAKDEISEPKTKLEKFTAKTGVVIIRGFQKIGSARGLYNSSVNVESKEFTNVGNEKKEYGITIETVEADGKNHTSYIDYDEIESLIKGIDYITGVKPDVTNFQNFQADYKTRGDLGVSTFSSEGEILASVTSGKYGSADAFYEINELRKVRELIVKAKAKIDELKPDTRTPRKATSEESNEIPRQPVAEAETGADTSPKTNDVKASNTCEVSLITLSDVMWLNADEQDAMKIKFSVTNNHDFPISGVVVEFKFYDIAGKKLADDKLKSFSESLNAGEVKKFDQFNLGKYPKDTMKVVGEVVSVSN